MFRRVWAFPMVALVCLMMLAACGQGDGAAPATVTGVASAPTSTAGAAATKPATTATTRQASASSAAQAPATATAINSKGDPKSIVLGKPVLVLSKPTRTVVAVEVKNTGDAYASFTVKPRPRSSTKPALATSTHVSAMPAGATWTITMIADEIQARDQDLMDLYVDSFYVVPQRVDPTERQKIVVSEPVVSLSATGTRATVEAKNNNDKRIGFRLHIVFVKDGVVTATAQGDEVLEPGQSRTLAPLVEGVVDGAVPHVQVSNIFYR